MKRVLVLALLLAAGKASAQSQLVIVSGLGGDEKYRAAFASLSATLATAAHDRWKLPDSSITWLSEDSTAASPYHRGRSTRDNVVASVERAARLTSPAGQFVLVIIGHGAGEGAESRVSLPGPDITATDIARLLTRFTGQRVAIANLTSGSGDALQVLNAPGRVVLTATKSSYERNESRFAEYFVAALSGPGADVDKNGRVSMLEAFNYAATETKRYYENEGKFPTEHAQINDEMVARRFFLASNRPTATGSTQLEALYREQDRRRDGIDALRKRKGAMPPADYERELERLMVDYAAAARAIRRAEGAQ